MENSKKKMKEWKEHGRNKKLQIITSLDYLTKQKQTEERSINKEKVKRRKAKKSIIEMTDNEGMRELEKGRIKKLAPILSHLLVP